MRRREFIAGLGGTAAWAMVARAQQPAAPVIGFLYSESLDDVTRDIVAAFQQGLADVGYIDGRNVVFEYRLANSHNDQLPALALELVRRPVDLIYAIGTPAALAAKAVTTTIPIVFFNASDPVRIGLVASLSRPGRNITGISNLGTGLTAKRLQMLHEVVPATMSMAMLVNPANPVTNSAVNEAQNAAQAIGVNLLVVNARSQDEIAAAFSGLFEQRVSALLVSAESLFITQIDKIIALAARYRIPASYEFRVFTIAGGLMSYGTDLRDAHRQAGVYAGRILKGEKPVDLPVAQAAKFQLVLNLKTAKALGIDLPTSILLRADEVIE
jgi:putative tryptophan/tyrosine transport system substrate-binding protein